MASTETAVARKLASQRQLSGFKPIPIDASVILLFLSDVEGGANSPCAAMVKRAMEFKGRSINFFVTAYYADDNGDSRVDRLGWKKSENDKSFREMSMDYVKQYQAGLTVSTQHLMHECSLQLWPAMDRKAWGDTAARELVPSPQLRPQTPAHGNGIRTPSAADVIAIARLQRRHRPPFFH
jgi:hypothetical protein